MRHSILVRLGLCLCATITLASQSPAQTQSRFEATLGVGTGTGTIRCSACTHAGNMGGTTYTLQLFASPQPQVRVGAMMDCWGHATDTWERDLCSLSVAALYYPRTLRHGFFIGGGPSYGMMWASLTDTTALLRHGWGMITEMGFELRPRSTFSLTPYAQYSYAYVGDIYYPKDSGIPWARGWKHSVVTVGLGLTYHAAKE